MKHTATSIFALCGLMAGQTFANEFKFDTSELQDKMMKDMHDMIANYDFSAILEEAVDSTAAHVIDRQSEQKPTVGELLAELSVALADQKAEMWPDATLKDSEMLDHINVEFDLHSGKVIAETAARDNHGNAKYQYIYDTASHNVVEVEQVVVEPVQEKKSFLDSFLPKKKDQAVPAKVDEPVVPAEPVPEETQESVVATPDAEVVEPVVPVESESPYDERYLSIEEQREIALRVTGFFFCLIIGTFLILFAYHKIEQKTKPAEKKQSFFDFMAGQTNANEKFPIYANVNTRFAI